MIRSPTTVWAGAATGWAVVLQVNCSGAGWRSARNPASGLGNKAADQCVGQGLPQARCPNEPSMLVPTPKPDGS